MEVGWVSFLEAEPKKGFCAGGVREKSEESRGKYAKQGRGPAGD